MIQQIKLKARNGAVLSVVVGEHMYCTPRNDDGPYTRVECGVWKESKVPDSWMEHADCEAPGDDKVWVFAYLPIELIADWDRTQCCA